MAVHRRTTAARLTMAFGDLCTLNDLYGWIVPPPPAVDDPILERLIAAASDFIYQYLHRFIPLAQYTEVINGHGGPTIVLANRPVVQITGLTVGINPITQSANNGIGYLFTPTAVTLHGYAFTRGQQNVTITYVSGYTDIPAAITQACIELVTLRYKERGREGVAQESVVGIKSDTYRVIDFAPSTLSSLLPFRNIVPSSPSALYPTPSPIPPI